MTAVQSLVSAPAAADEVAALRAGPPHRSPTAAGLWPLAPPPLRAYRCGACGLYGLHPRLCCGARTQRVHAPYYVSCSSRPVEGSDLSVILVTKDDMPRARRLVESLRQVSGDATMELIIVDGGSADGSLNYFRDLARRETVQLVVTHPSEPFREVRNANRGAEAASGRLLFFARSTPELRDGEALSRLARCLEDPRAGVAGLGARGACSGGADVPPPPEGAWAAGPVGTGLWGIRAEVFWELGGLDESFRAGAYAAIDLQYRALHRNYRLAALDGTSGDDGAAGGRVDGETDEAQFATRHGRRLSHGNRSFPAFAAHVAPSVSVAIACRNYGRYLPRALDSALGSYLPDGTQLQVVVVNDASSDDTAGILEQYRLRDPERVTVLHRPISRGPAPAKNQAMARCIGAYTAPLDADDEFLEYKLWHSLRVLEEAGAEFLYHDFVQVEADGRQDWYRIGRWSLKRWRTGTRLPPGAWVFRSGLVHFAERQITGEDPDFLSRNWHRMKTVYLPEALTRYHMHGSGLSTRAMCKVVTGQLKGLGYADVSRCSDIEEHKGEA